MESSSVQFLEREREPLLERPSGGHRSARKRLRLWREAAESSSQGEGPLPTKRGRLAFAAELGSTSFCSTAPSSGHLLPSAPDKPQTATDLLKSWRQPETGLEAKSHTDTRRPAPPSRPPSFLSRSLLINFEESMLKGRFPPSGQIEGVTALISVSHGKYFQLPVKVTKYDLCDHGRPAPYLGVISLDSFRGKGCVIPDAGTVQVVLLNPQKNVEKVFLVPYDLSDMPSGHMTFLRHRSFLVAVEDGKRDASPGADGNRILHSLIHLRFQRSTSGRLSLHHGVRLLYRNRSTKVHTGGKNKLESSTEGPRNPDYCPSV